MGIQAPFPCPENVGANSVPAQVLHWMTFARTRVGNDGVTWLRHPGLGYVRVAKTTGLHGLSLEVTKLSTELAGAELAL